MLRFDVFSNGRPAEQQSLQGAYLVGSDGVPLRAELKFQSGQIICTKRAAGPAALALPWHVRGFGTVMQETVRLPEREQAYNLHMELVRGRLMRIAQKREDWGLFDYEGCEPITGRISKARDLLIRALQAETSAEIAEFGDQALCEAVSGGEELSLFHAEIFLSRRIQNGTFGPAPLGCVADLNNFDEPYRKNLAEAFDYVTLPIHWRTIESKEQEFTWLKLEKWVDWLGRNQIPIKAGPLVSFDEYSLPDWLYIWEHDFETVRDMTTEHARRVVKRYAHAVTQWHVISGLHANNSFNFNFERIMEMTRLVTSLTKQLAPRSVIVIDVVAPWGEYYARNQRSIPPLLYADMAVQSGINFDAIGLQFYFGRSSEGMFVRDMFQISAILDRFSNLGKPLHVSALQAPSSVLPAEPENGHSLPKNPIHGGGYWHGEWNEAIQAKWLKHFCLVALSKPFVESITWRGLCDPKEVSNLPGASLPTGGLIRADGTPKAGYRTLLKIREEIRRRDVQDAAARPSEL